jgi:hypothetical protein
MRLLLLISIAAISFAPRAFAQSAEAEQLFSDGDKDMKLGRLEQACDAFEASNRIEARAGTLIRLGQCREELHQLASAWSAYKDAAIRAKDPKKQKVATGRIAALEPKLSHLTLRVSDRIEGLELARDGKPIDPGLWGHAIPINGGDYEITASAPNHAGWSQKVTVPNEHGEVTVTVPLLEESATTPPPRKKEVRVADIQPPEPVGIMSTKRDIAIGVGVVGVGAIVAGALLGHSAQGQRDDAYKLCPDPAMPCASSASANNLISTAHTRAIEADVAFGAGAVAAIVATTLWVTGAPERPMLDAQLSSHGASLALIGRW